jgi:hypothetical protein
MALNGWSVYVKSKGGLYLVRGPTDYTYVWGTVVTQPKTDDNAVWLMRWSFDNLGQKTAGPQQDNSRWPSSETNSTNFHLVHPDGTVTLCWPSSDNNWSRGQLYLAPYYIEGGEDGSADDHFNCRRDVLENDPAGYSYFALNNSDRSFVADIYQGTSTVGAWQWNGQEQQKWQFIKVGGPPV